MAIFQAVRGVHISSVNSHHLVLWNALAACLQRLVPSIMIKVSGKDHLVLLREERWEALRYMAAKGNLEKEAWCSRRLLSKHLGSAQKPMEALINKGRRVTKPGEIATVTREFYANMFENGLTAAVAAPKERLQWPEEMEIAGGEVWTVPLALFIHLVVAGRRAGSGTSNEPSVAWPATAKADPHHEGSGTDTARQLYAKTPGDENASGSRQRDSLLKTGWQPPKIRRYGNGRSPTQSSPSRASALVYEVRPVSSSRSARLPKSWDRQYAEPAHAPSADDSYVFHITSVNEGSPGSGAGLEPSSASFRRARSGWQNAEFDTDPSDRQVYVVKSAPVHAASDGWAAEPVTQYQSSAPQVMKHAYLVKTAVLDTDVPAPTYSAPAFDSRSYHASFAPTHTGSRQTYVVKSIDPSAALSGYKSAIRNAVSGALRFAGTSTAPLVSSKKVYVVRSSAPSMFSSSGWPSYGFDSEPLTSGGW
ncbi:uncharacterized protein LOC135395222 [Ornithodoros turicata]|uniref:uncharacterized protein LOC135395222 n=1 Tax=Ornithodoros turicata TaxID=34597 RepID=UPI00313A371F